MINSRNIADLNPHVAILCTAFISECKKQGIEILITSTFRDEASQNALYAQGRTLPGNKVTNARAGFSWHQWKCAFDFVPIVNGKAQWNDIALFDKCGTLAEECGLEYAGRWKKFKERCHCQFTNGHDLAYFQTGNKF